MSKKTAQKKRIKPRPARSGGHRLACNCAACQVQQGMNDGIFHYVLADARMFNALQFHRTRVATDAYTSLINRAGAILESRPGPAFDAEKIYLPDHERTVVPGYVILYREHLFVDGDPEDYPMEAARMVPLDIWGLDFRDGGKAHLQEILRWANASFGPNDGFTIALWVTGFYDDEAPIHVLVADTTGEFAGFLLGGHVCEAFPATVMEAAMQRLVAEMMGVVASWQTLVRGYTGPDVRLKPSADRYYAALVFSQEKNVYLVERTGELFNGVEVRAGELATMTTRAIREAGSDYGEQLRALAVEHAKEIEGHRSRALARDAELLVLRKERDALKAAAAAQPGAAVNEGIKEEAPQTPFDADKPAEHDEGYSHWRETADHQAVVLRQLRLALQHATTPMGDAGADDVATGPARSLAELEDWAAENADRVVLLSRAVNAAKKSIYENEALIFEALDAIAVTYREVKLGLADRMAFKSRCQDLGLEVGGSISEAPSKDYFFLWNGRQIFLDQHVGRGNARDPRFCLRIYFTWDEREGKVIIGSLPTHLPTRNT